MTAKNVQRNPYIAGRALGQDRGFFGRSDLLRVIESNLHAPEQNALVLFGQRRIGKTSILLQLQRRLPSPPFLPVYFDLMDRARRQLGQVLYEIASTISNEAGMAPCRQELFDDQGIYFRHTFLPALYQFLGDQRNPVLLLDEFDVLDAAAEDQLSPSIASQAFFPYLRELLDSEPRLKFVFVIGRRAEDLSINIKATFKTSLYQRVSVLDERSARELITTADRQSTLIFEPTAIDRILELTSGHPYFLQLLCQLLWDIAHDDNSSDIPRVDKTLVDNAIPRLLEAGHNIFEWIWNGLPPAECVIFAAIAEATNEQTIVTEHQLTPLLQSRGIRILTRELELAPETLVEWQMLRKVNNGYQFFIELMRRWVATYKPLQRVKDELDRIVPLADTLYRSADVFYRQSDSDSAQDQLRKALRTNPNHLKARLLLGQILLEQGAIDEAIRELEEAYKYHEEAARYPLIRALLLQADEMERSTKDDIALTIYDRVLDLSPQEKVAQERRVAIWMKVGNAARRIEDFATALAAYHKAGAQEKINEIIEVQRKHEQLGQLYAEGIAAFEQQKWLEAVRSLADVVNIHPYHRDAADLLARAVSKAKKTDLVATASGETKKQDYDVLFKDLLKVLVYVYTWVKQHPILSIIITLIALLLTKNRYPALSSNGILSIFLLVIFVILPYRLIKMITTERRFSGALRNIKQGNYDLAINNLDQYITLRPNQKGFNYRGLAYYNIGDIDRAIADFSHAIKLQPANSLVYYNRGMAYGKRGDYDQALSDLDQAIRYNRNYAEAYYARGTLYGRAAEKNKAIASFKRALELSKGAAQRKQAQDQLNALGRK